MRPERLEALFHQPEGERLEFKRNVPKDPRRIAEAVAAFANTAGGTLVVGYDENAGSPVGLANIDRDLGRVETALHWVQPRLDVRPERVDVGRKSFIVVEVPASLQFPHRVDRRVLQRSGPRNAPITTEVAVRRVEAAPSPSAEERNLAEAIAEQSQLIEQLRQQAGWRKQLPLQVAFLTAGVFLGYVIGGWNPFGFG
jgi:predicted HTH transcriptional regulator